MHFRPLFLGALGRKSDVGWWGRVVSRKLEADFIDSASLSVLAMLPYKLQSSKRLSLLCFVGNGHANGFMILSVTHNPLGQSRVRSRLAGTWLPHRSFPEDVSGSMVTCCFRTALGGAYLVRKS